MKKVINFSILMSLFGCVALLSGCSATAELKQPKAELIQPGDRVKIVHSCSSLRTGQLLSSIEPEVLQDESLKQSKIFFQPKQVEPWEVIAGIDSGGPAYGKLHPFENELIAQISRQLVGQAVGENLHLNLQARTPEGLSEKERYLKISRIETRPNVISVKLDDFVKRYGKNAEVGQIAYSAKGVVGRIVSVTENAVSVKLTIEPGTVVPTPFGKGIVEPEDDGYRIVTTPDKGQLVKSAFLLGRVVEITDSYFVIDYGNPFAGETLSCDVTVVERSASVSLTGNSAK